MLGNSDYTVKYDPGRKNVGTYKVTVSLKGRYVGSKTVSFRINPKPTKLKKPAALKKGFRVKWARRKTQTTGYQLQYSTSRTFKKCRNVWITKRSAVTKRVTKLKAKKKYYIRIRTYKKVNGKKYYSTWSKTKSVKTKK